MTDPMHQNHDLDLISSLAEGVPIDRAAAESLLATCPECAAAYDAHLTVLRAIEEEPGPSLTDLERHRLHEALWDEIGNLEHPTPGAGWWTKLVPAAAVLAVVAGLAVVLSQPPGEDTAPVQIAADAPDVDATEEAVPFGDERVEADRMPTGDGEETEGDAGTATTTAAGDDEMETIAESSGAVTWPVDEFRERVLADEAEVHPDFECEEATAGQRLVAAEPVDPDSPIWLVAVETDDAIGVLVVDGGDCSVLETHE